MVIVDQVLFIMPKSREYQFPAIGVVQDFVNTYQQKMMAQNPAGNPLLRYQLKYDVDISGDDWDFFQQIGLQLIQPREELTEPDMVVDLREEKLEQFSNLPRHHVSEIYGAMCGIKCPSLPKIRKVKPKMTPPYEWVVLATSSIPNMAISGSRLGLPTVTDIHTAQDGDISGVISVQSWESYLAASMMLPVIEIVPERTWRLSKWKNPLYRMVEANKGSVVELQVERAMKNIEAALAYLAKKEEANVHIHQQ